MHREVSKMSFLIKDNIDERNSKGQNCCCALPLKGFLLSQVN